jgi:hypothetical protein
MPACVPCRRRSPVRLTDNPEIRDNGELLKIFFGTIGTAVVYDDYLIRRKILMQKRIECFFQ